MDPLYALIIGIIFLFLIISLFKPNGGLVSKLLKIKRDTYKELLEDILKYLYNSEISSREITIKKLSDDLNLSADQTEKLISQTVNMKLVSKLNDNLVLTTEGKTYALRIIRVHRLWEKYLAENTSVNETEWHNIAERKEHELDREEINQLAAKLGNPLLDPHGDPIPNELGDLPGSNGISLDELNDGEFGRIIHIEDEPKESYAQLIAMGLYPGMQIRILEKSDDKISIAADGDECKLAYQLAQNITVIPLSEKEIIYDSFISLSSIKEGESAEVISLSKALRGQQRRRLLDLGVVPGSKITAQLKSLNGDPTAYEIRGATIALRKKQSDYIFIKKIENTA